MIKRNLVTTNPVIIELHKNVVIVCIKKKAWSFNISISNRKSRKRPQQLLYETGLWKRSSVGRGVDGADGADGASVGHRWAIAGISGRPWVDPTPSPVVSKRRAKVVPGQCPHTRSYFQPDKYEANAHIARISIRYPRS